MGEPTTSQGRIARSCINRSRLEARLLSDRYDLTEHAGDAHARGWTSAMQHVQHVILPALDREEQLLDALRELRDAPAMDLRLKHALVLDEQVIQGRFDLSDCEAVA